MPDRQGRVQGDQRGDGETGGGAMIGNPFEPIGGGVEPGEPGGARMGKPFGPMFVGGGVGTGRGRWPWPPPPPVPP